jgi:hypothetical protein
MEPATMDDNLARILSDLVARTTGPMWFRLILQPLVAIILGVHAGLRNARAARSLPPSHTLDEVYRSRMLRQALYDVGKVALIGGLLDLVFQWIALHKIYPLEAVLVVFFIVVLPYQVIRTVVAWLAGRKTE